MKFIICTRKTLLFAFFICIILIVLAAYSYNLLVVTTASNTEFSDDFLTSLTKNNEKIAYLTFDDGPNKIITPKILDILKSENIKASFFVIGKYVEKYPEIVKRAYDEGHYIANHTYSHNNSILYKSSEDFMNEIEKTDLAIGKAIDIDNYCSHIFRFPNGFMAPLYKSEKKEATSLLSKMHYNYIDWNCLNKDSEKKYSSSQLLNNLKNSCKTKNSLVILMHDTRDVSDSSLVLKDSIDFLKSEGYVFKNFYDI